MSGSAASARTATPSIGETGLVPEAGAPLRPRQKPAVSPARSTTAASAVYLARREMRTRRSSRRSRLFGRRCMWFGMKITPIGQSGCFVLSIL